MKREPLNSSEYFVDEYIKALEDETREVTKWKTVAEKQKKELNQNKTLFKKIAKNLKNENRSLEEIHLLT